jgi:hypothetical protein
VDQLSGWGTWRTGNNIYIITFFSGIFLGLLLVQCDLQSGVEREQCDEQSQDDANGQKSEQRTCGFLGSRTQRYSSYGTNDADHRADYCYHRESTLRTASFACCYLVFHKGFTFHVPAHPEATTPGETLISNRDLAIHGPDSRFCQGLSKSAICWLTNEFISDAN